MCDSVVTYMPNHTAGAILQRVGSALQPVHMGDIIIVLATVRDDDEFDGWKHWCMLASSKLVWISNVSLRRLDFFAPVSAA